ncbi:MAG: hypothetical protein R3C26_08450 [Calditrichia bacterium]
MKVDDHTVIQIKQLLDLLQHPVLQVWWFSSEGHFIALSKQFRRQLEDLRTFSDRHQKRCTISSTGWQFDHRCFAGEIGKFSGRW